MLIGDKVRLLRMQKGFSQEQLAYYAGVSIKTIQRVENNYRISVESLRGIAAAFDKDIDEFLGDYQHLGLVKEEFTKQAEGINESSFFRDEHVINRILSFAGLREDEVVMDLGCGTGILTVAMAPYVKTLIAVDVTEKMIRETMDRCKSKQLENVRYITSNSEKIPVATGSVDKIVIRLGFHHFYNIPHVMRELLRILKQDGLLVIADIITSSDPSIGKLHNAIEKLRDPSHVQLYSEDDFIDLASRYNLKVMEQYNYHVERTYSEWLDITQSPERYEPLKVMLNTLVKHAIPSGMQLKLREQELCFQHTWLFMVLKK